VLKNRLPVITERPMFVRQANTRSKELQMPPHILIHAGHVLHEALTGATEEGGGWAWAGLILGGIFGYFLTLGSGGPTNEGIVVVGILLTGLIAVLGAYLGVLCKLAIDKANGKGSKPDPD
jgi:hypothetical protein